MATVEQIREVNVTYHDLAAHEYDAKWSIDFGATGRAQVLGKLERALGALPAAPWDRALEVGAGTGYVSLNLAGAGLVRRQVVVAHVDRADLLDRGHGGAGL